MNSATINTAHRNPRPAAAAADAAPVLSQNERIRRGLTLALGELHRLEQLATVVSVDVSGARPVVTLEQPLAAAAGHYITRKSGDRRTTVWVAERNGCQLECESDQPLPMAARR